MDKLLFVDSGVYSYISKNESRKNNLKTSAHNTLQINNLEQNQIFNDFRYPNRNAIGQLLKHNQKYFAGEHIGFISTGLIHKREVFFENDILKITDHVKAIKSIENSEIFIFYHVHPRYKVSLNEENSIKIQGDNDTFLVSTKGIDSAMVSDSLFSEEYGKKEKNFVIRFTGNILKGEKHTMFTVEIQKHNPK